MVPWVLLGVEMRPINSDCAVVAGPFFAHQASHLPGCVVIEISDNPKPANVDGEQLHEIGMEQEAFVSGGDNYRQRPGRREDAGDERVCLLGAGAGKSERAAFNSSITDAPAGLRLEDLPDDARTPGSERSRSNRGSG